MSLFYFFCLYWQLLKYLQYIPQSCYMSNRISIWLLVFALYGFPHHFHSRPKLCYMIDKQIICSMHCVMAEVLIRHVYWEFAAYSRHSVALQLIKDMHDVWKFQVTLHVSDLSHRLYQHVLMPYQAHCTTVVYQPCCNCKRHQGWYRSIVSFCIIECIHISTLIAAYTCILKRVHAAMSEEIISHSWCFS